MNIRRIKLSSIPSSATCDICVNYFEDMESKIVYRIDYYMHFDLLCERCFEQLKRRMENVNCNYCNNNHKGTILDEEECKDCDNKEYEFNKIEG